MSGRIIALAATVAVVAAGWTGGWYWLAGKVGTEMDRALGRLAVDGVVVTCPDRAIGGFPFRMEVTCERPTATLPDGSTLTAARFAATGVVSDLELLRLAAEAPLTATAADGTRLDAGFASLVASVRHDFSGHVGRVSVAATTLDARVIGADGATGRLTADEAEVHVRPVEASPEDLDLALSATRAVGEAGGAAVLPAPADVGLAGVVRRAALFGGDPERLRAWTAAGGEIGLSQAVLAVGGTRLEASGTAALAEDGRPKAEIALSATGIGWLGDQVKAGKPVPPLLTTLASAMLLLGRPDGERRTMTVKADAGAVSANGLPLGKLPKLF